MERAMSIDLDTLAAALYSAQRDPLSEMPWGPHLLPGQREYWLRIAEVAKRRLDESWLEERRATAADRDRLADEVARLRMELGARR
jgi:hypothetical protein